MSNAIAEVGYKVFGLTGERCKAASNREFGEVRLASYSRSITVPLDVYIITKQKPATRQTLRQILDLL